MLPNSGRPAFSFVHINFRCFPILKLFLLFVGILFAKLAQPTHKLVWAVQRFNEPCLPARRKA